MACGEGKVRSAGRRGPARAGPAAMTKPAGEISGTYYWTNTGASSLLEGLAFGPLDGQDAARCRKT